MKPKYKEWIGKWYSSTRQPWTGSIFVLDVRPSYPGSIYFEIEVIDYNAKIKTVRLSRRAFQLYYEKTERTTSLSQGLIEAIFID